MMTEELNMNSIDSVEGTVVPQVLPEHIRDVFAKAKCLYSKSEVDFENFAMPGFTCCILLRCTTMRVTKESQPDNKGLICPSVKLQYFLPVNPMPTSK